MEQTYSINLLYGLKKNNKLIRRARIRQLTGYDQRYFNSLLRKKVPSSIKLTYFLSRLVTCIKEGSAEDNNNDDYDYDDLSFSHYKDNEYAIDGTTEDKLDIEKVINELSIGDRMLLLLNFYMITFGKEMQCEIRCPQCKNMVSIDIEIPKLLQSLIGEKEFKPFFENKMIITFDNFKIVLRPVTGIDQQNIFYLTKKNEINTYRQISLNKNKKDSDFNKINNNNTPLSEQLIRSCIVSSEPSLPITFSPSMITTLSQKLDDLDPLANIVFDNKCPSCHHMFRIPFFVEDFVFKKILIDSRYLDTEIHWLAFYYHWNESEILSIPLAQRKRYLELISKTISNQ